MRPLRPNFDYQAPELEIRSVAEIVRETCEAVIIAFACFVDSVALVVVGLWAFGYFQ